jgi:hypothetical protein
LLHQTIVLFGSHQSQTGIIKSAMLWVKNDPRLIEFYKKQGYFVADDFVVRFKNF